MQLQRSAGIDLGATNVVTACVNNAGSTEIVRDREGNRWTPSVVLFDDGRYYVGEEAVLRGAGKSDALVRGAKQSLGKPLHDNPIRGEQFPPEVIQACLLHQADHALGAGMDAFALEQVVDARAAIGPAAVLEVPLDPAGEFGIHQPVVTGPAVAPGGRFSCRRAAPTRCRPSG